MRRYPEYKESGVEWIGEIPGHWEVVRSKHLFGNRNQRGYEGEPLLSVTQDRGVLPRNELDYRVWNPDGNLRSYKLVLPSDWVISLRTFEGGIELSEVRGIVSAAYTTMFPRRQIFNSYFKHLLKSVNFIAELNRITTGIRQGKNISYEDFSDTRVTFPPLNEQKAIANFLDRKTEQIDELIRIKERKTELLQEQRTVLINQSVTKGLDPNVEMKPSGVEWIGEIPKHWEVLKVKHVGSSNPSKNNPKTDCLKDKLVVFLPMERVHTDGTIDQELKLPYSQLKNGYTYFEENDVLIAKVTPCFENGKIVLVKNLATPVGFGSTEFIVIRPNPQKVFPPFLYYILYNAPLRSIGKHFMTSAVGLKRVPTKFVENFQISIPPKQEQIQIANFLDRKTQQIDELRSNEQQSIELLKEYRQTLISEVVTGKIDVRSAVAHKEKP